MQQIGLCQMLLPGLGHGMQYHPMCLRVDIPQGGALTEEKMNPHMASWLVGQRSCHRDHACG